MQDKRAQKRFDLRLVSRLRFLQDKGGSALQEVVTRNLSSRGAFFVSDETLPLGSKLKMEFVLPVSRLSRKFNDSQLTCSGTVIRHEADGFAVCFDKSCAISPLWGKTA